MYTRYCDIDTQGNKALVMKQYLEDEKVSYITICLTSSVS